MFLLDDFHQARGKVYTSKGSIIQIGDNYFQKIPGKKQISGLRLQDDVVNADLIGLDIDRRQTYQKIDRIGEGTSSRVKKTRKIRLNYKLCVVTEDRKPNPGELYIFEEGDHLACRAVLNDGSILKVDVTKESLRNKYGINPDIWNENIIKPFFLDLLALISKKDKRFQPFAMDEKDKKPYVTRITVFKNMSNAHLDNDINKIINKLIKFHPNPDSLYFCVLKSSSKKENQDSKSEECIKLIQIMPYGGENLNIALNSYNQKYLEKKRNDRLTPKDTLQHYRHYLKMMHKIIKAVKEFHGKGSIHLDLKPFNILVDEHGNVTLIDYDGAKLIDSEETHPTITYGYCAPEVMRSRFFPIYSENKLDNVTGEKYKNSFVYIYDNNNLNLYYFDEKVAPLKVKINQEEVDKLKKKI